MSSAVVVFNILTFPGLVLNKAAQEYYVRKFEISEKSPNVDEIAKKLNEEKEKKGREEAFGEDTGDTVRRMSSEKAAYIDYYEVEEFEDCFLATSAPFFVSSGVGFFFMLLSALFFGGSRLMWLLSFWVGAAFAVHSFPDEIAADALWRKSGETERRLRFVGYGVAAFSKPMNATDTYLLETVYAVFLFVVALLLLGVF